MATSADPTSQVIALQPILQAAAKNLLFHLYGEAGPPWGTSFADLEELALRLDTPWLPNCSARDWPVRRPRRRPRPTPAQAAAAPSRPAPLPPLSLKPTDHVVRPAENRRTTAFEKVWLAAGQNPKRSTQFRSASSPVTSSRSCRAGA
jgi:hypothetical protein